MQISRGRMYSYKYINKPIKNQLSLKNTKTFLFITLFETKKLYTNVFLLLFDFQTKYYYVKSMSGYFFSLFSVHDIVDELKNTTCTIFLFS